METPAFGSHKDKGFFKDPFSDGNYDSIGSADQAYNYVFNEKKQSQQP